MPTERVVGQGRTACVQCTSRTDPGLRIQLAPGPDEKLTLARPDSYETEALLFEMEL